MGPSDSERENRRDSDGQHQQQSHPPRLGVTAPSADSESGGSLSPSPRASRRRQVYKGYVFFY